MLLGIENCINYNSPLQLIEITTLCYTFYVWFSFACGSILINFPEPFFFFNKHTQVSDGNFPLSFFFKKDFIDLFLEREEEREKCVVASCTPLTGDLAHNPGTCPDWESNWRPFGSQAGTQSTESHQPGLHLPFLMFTCANHSVLACKGV